MGKAAVRIAVVAVALSLLSSAATAEGTFVYKLRGEVRLLLPWVGRDDVGGGRITITRSGAPSGNRWTEQIEVLFGSEPDRIPNRINRWGYGRETAEWVRETGDPGPRLLSTEFLGLMRHSAESSVGEALAMSKEAAAAHRYLYDGTRSRVLPTLASSELRILAEDDELHYKRADRLLAKYSDALKNMPPTLQKQLANAGAVYGAPYGFLTGLSDLVRQVLDKRDKPSLRFVFNAKVYTLEVLSVKQLGVFDTRLASSTVRYRDTALIHFRCFNTVKQTRTDFDLWIPLTGDLRGVPVRILLQPRWWLRLQMDLDPANRHPGAGS
jgi:hypothetical protein